MPESNSKILNEELLSEGSRQYVTGVSAVVNLQFNLLYEWLVLI